MKNTLTIFFFLTLLSSTVFAQTWTVIPYDQISDEGLRIISLHEDTDGNVWGGNAYAGRIVRWDGTNWETFNNDVTGMDYDSPSVPAILQDAGGKMWFCSGDGVATWENGNWVNYKTSNSDIPQSFASNVIEENGTMWFTMRQSLVSFDGSTWTEATVPDADWNAIGLASMGNGSFFISLANGDPIRRFDGTNWEIFNTDNSNVSSNYQYVVEKVDDQTFWFGGPNGRANLYEDGTWTQSADMPGWTLGLGGYINEIAINGSKDDAWFANGDGLFHFKNGVGTEYNPSNSPMTSEIVQTVIIASDGKIWCTTENELLILDPGITNSTTEVNANLSLNISPNPVQKTVNLMIESKDITLNQNSLITIYNTIGQPVITQKITDLQMNINVENLARGIYILEYTDNEHKTTTQFVKQ